MPSIKRRSTRVPSSSSGAGSDQEEEDARGSPAKRPRTRVRERATSSSEDDLMSDLNDVRDSATATTTPGPDVNDEDEDEDSDEDTGVTTMDTSLTISPTHASSSSAFRPKQEPRAARSLGRATPRRSNGRPNVSQDNDSEMATVDADDDEDDDDDEDEAVSPSTSEDELGDDDDDQLEERQRELELIEQAHGGGMVAEAGVIEKVELRNFMCHTRLTVKLKPQVNFIIGHNGSGKSAILTGISIALGGKATSTSRATSIKAFVKEGCEAAQVSVWIKNRGVDAFKHGYYGDSILIERRINADGGGSWKLKNAAKGNTVSNKKEELVALCDHTNIQVDNPMNILTQDAARQFLSSSNPYEMYDFFLRGTQLQQLSEQYQALDSVIKNIKTRVQQEQEYLPDLQRAAHDAAHKFQLMEKQKDFLAKEEKIKHQLVWCQVEQLEKELEQSENQRDRVQSKIEKLEADIARLIDDRQSLNDKITELEEQSKNDAERIAPLHAERQALRQTIQTLKQDLVKAKEKERSANSQYTRLSRHLEELQKRIDQEAAKLAQDTHEKHNRLEARRRDIEERRRLLEEEEADVRDRLRKHDPELKKVAALEASSFEARERLRHEVVEHDMYLQRLSAASRNSMEAFGAHVPELLRAINQEGRWHKKPIGPIGAYVKLKDPKWAPVLESVIGNTLNAFCVVDHHDRRVLESLKQRLRCGQVPILTASDEAFDFSNGEPREDVLTILRVLDISNDYVLRQLVNAVHIECSALVQHRPEGDQLMRKNIRNVKYCFSADMYRLGGGTIGSSTQTLNRYTGPPRLSSDLEGKLAETRAGLERLQKELSAANERLRDAQSQKRRLEEAAKNNRQLLNTIGKKLLKVRDEMVQLDDEVRVDEPANVAAIEEARRDAREELDKCKAQFEEVQAEKEVIESKMRPEVERSEDLKKQIESSADDAGALKLETGNVLRQRMQNHQTEKLRNETLAKNRAELTELETAIEQGREDVESALAQAMQYSEGVRYEAHRSREYYERELQSVEKLIQEAQRRGGGTLEEVTKEYNRAHKAYTDADKKVSDANALTKALQTALDARVRMWKHFRHHIALSARSSFSSHLANRGYSGKLQFSHESGRLQVYVQTDDSQGTAAATQGGRASQKGKDAQHRRKDPKSLSGGEKSFSTVCLLLALWQAIGCPIRCLDEFDVFMDAVNRRQSMSMMIDAAKKSPGIQYVLITPLSMTSANFGPEVNIQKLSDPKRGQGVLEFGAT